MGKFIAEEYQRFVFTVNAEAHRRGLAHSIPVASRLWTSCLSGAIFVSKELGVSQEDFLEVMIALLNKAGMRRQD